MLPTIITIAIIKGGSGKTTTSMALAEGLAMRGKTVTVLDSDNTGGATLWQEYVANENDRRQHDDPSKTPQPARIMPAMRLHANQPCAAVTCIHAPGASG